MMPRPAAKVRILHFKHLRHSDMASVLITTLEIFTRVSPDNSLERLTECGVGLVTDQSSNFWELFVEQLAEAAQVHHAVRQYLREVEEQNPVEEPVHEQDQVSTTDPDSTYATKGGTPARLGYYDNYLVDNHSCVIVGVQATAARMSQETVAAQDMLTRFFVPKLRPSLNHCGHQ